MRPHLLPLLFVVALTSCQSDPATLCTKYFEPYPDMVSSRYRNNVNARYIDAMIAYRSGDYATAAEGLEDFLRVPNNDMAVRLYLCNAYLALGEPGKAELQLDFIERSKETGFNDQVDWYNALCLLCSGQPERAKAQAEYIASRPAHAYKVQADRLASSL